jgi:hypothetical protein
VTDAEKDIAAPDRSLHPARSPLHKCIDHSTDTLLGDFMAAPFGARSSFMTATFFTEKTIVIAVTQSARRPRPKPASSPRPARSPGA